MKKDYVTVKEMKELEKKADSLGLSYYTMMENAGEASFKEILRLWGNDIKGVKVGVFCGKGNNGGDALVVSRKLIEAKCNVKTFLVQGEVKTPDAIKNYEILKDMGGYISNEPSFDFDIIVDGIYGTGFKGKMKDDILEIVKGINKSKALVLSIDIPSGLYGDMGEKEPLPFSVKSDVTVTFHEKKRVHNNVNISEAIINLYIRKIGIENII